MAWAPDYATTQELRDYLRIGDALDDSVLTLANTAAARAIDRACNRQFGNVSPAVERRYTARWDRRRRRWVVEIDDLMTTTDLAFTCEAGTIDVYDKIPLNAAADGRPWEAIVIDPQSAALPDWTEGGVTGVGRWGWTSVPAPIKAASLLQASRLVQDRDAPFGVAGSPELGSEIRLLAKVHPDVAVMIGDFVRWWGAA